jgi:hypothetical protein
VALAGGRSELGEKSGFAEIVDIGGIQSALTSWMMVFKRDCLRRSPKRGS